MSLLSTKFIHVCLVTYLCCVGPKTPKKAPRALSVKECLEEKDVVTTVCILLRDVLKVCSRKSWCRDFQCKDSSIVVLIGTGQTKLM